MQAILITTLIVLIGFFTLIETTHDSVTFSEKSYMLKADMLAANILQYNDLVVRFVTSNYDTLHETDSDMPGAIEKIKKIDWSKDDVASYSAFQFIPFFNYTTLLFNYVNSTDAADYPLLYMVTSFDEIASKQKHLGQISLDAVMGKLGDKLDQILYQGSNISWVEPILLSQDGGCNVLEVFGQVPLDSNGSSQLERNKEFFHRFCLAIQENAAYRFKKYVYFAPIIPSK